MGTGLVKGSLIGGAIVFVWMMISWMLIPWHCAVMQGFKNEEAVARVIMENTDRDGVYILPDMCQRKDHALNAMDAMKKGPVVFASVQRYGFDAASIAPFIISFIIQLIGAFLITFILLQMSEATYWTKVLSATLIGLTAGIVALLPSWNWWGLSFTYVLTLMCDLVIAWFLAGLAISAFAKIKK